MSIGPDIKEVLQEVGSEIIIIKPDGSTVTGEYCDTENYYEMSTEFIRQFCFSGDFQYDTASEEGDVVSLDDKFLLIINQKKSRFESEIVESSCFLVECNTFGAFARKGETRNANYEMVTSWDNILHTDVHAVQTEGEPKIEEDESMDFVFNRFILYCPYHSDIREGDRWYPDKDNTDEYYQILSVSKYRYRNVLYCKLTEDSRE